MFACALAVAGCTEAGTGTAGPDTAAATSAPEVVVEEDTCPAFDDGTETGRISDTSLTEISGLAASRRNPGVLWVHDDSDADATVAAIGIDGATLHTYRLDGIEARDWEDVAVGPGPDDGVSYLYLGDIGDNLGNQKQFRIIRIAEPDVPLDATGRTTLRGAATLTGRFPDGSHNAETLLSDPADGALYVVTKGKDTGSGVYRWPAPQESGSRATLERVGTLEFGTAPLSGDARATGGDISPDGAGILVRTYTSAFLWNRAPGTSIADALAGTPCPVPVRLERQGEAIAWAENGGSYFSTSEGKNPPLIRYDRASR